MADLPTIEAIETVELILLVDSARPKDNPFKLPDDFLVLHAQRHRDARDANAAAEMGGADTTGALVDHKGAIARLDDPLRNAHAGIKAVPDEDLPAGARAPRSHGRDLVSWVGTPPAPA